MSTLYALLRKIITGIILAFYNPGARRAGRCYFATRGGALPAATTTSGSPATRAHGSLSATMAAFEE